MMVAAPAHAETIHGLFNGGDSLHIETTGTARADITYHNAGSQTSIQGTMVLRVLGIEVGVHVRVHDAETLTITVPPGWIAIPDQIDVPDGSSGTVAIMPAMF